MSTGFFGLCCCFPAMASEKPRVDDCRTGVGTDMALPGASRSNDHVTDSTAGGNLDEHKSDVVMSVGPSTASNFESQIVMNGSEAKELSSFPSPLYLQPIPEPEDERSRHEAKIERLPPCVDGMEISTEATEPSNVDRTIQAFLSPPHSLNAKAIADPHDDPENDRVNHVLAISPQLSRISEAAEEEVSEVKPRLSPQRAANDQNSTLRAVTSTAEGVIIWSLSRTTTSTLTLEKQSEPIVMQQENFSNPSSWSPPDPPDPDPGSSSFQPLDVDMSSTEDSANDLEGSIFDSDDHYHSDTSSYTASLLSDVKDYAYENGRRYHSYREGHYVLPNDEQEQDRQDLLHHVRNLVLNGALFRAPLENSIQRALDIGTGTGIWAIDFADSYPSAEVIGTDLSPIQPSWVPPNLRFLVDDAEEPWLFSASRPFDFIHARDLGGAIADWPRLLRQAHEHLKPGGWIELQEFEVTLKSDDDTMRLAPTLCEYISRLHEASEAFQRPMNIAEGHRQRLVDAGFENVRDEVYKVWI